VQQFADVTDDVIVTTALLQLDSNVSCNFFFLTLRGHGERLKKLRMKEICANKIVNSKNKIMNNGMTAQLKVVTNCI